MLVWPGLDRISIDRFGGLPREASVPWPHMRGIRGTSRRSRSTAWQYLLLDEQPEHATKHLGKDRRGHMGSTDPQYLVAGLWDADARSVLHGQTTIYADTGIFPHVLAR